MSLKHLAVSVAMVAALVLWAAPLSVLGQSFSDLGPESGFARFQLWTGCQPMSLVVEDLSAAASEIGLTEAALRAAAESRLRGARLYTAVPWAWDPPLYLRVSVVSSAFSVALRFNKQVYDPASGESYLAPTFAIGTTGTHGSDGASSSYILGSVSELLDQFLLQYLRVNESACE